MPGAEVHDVDSKRFSSELLICIQSWSEPLEPDPTLLKLLRRAYAWRQQLEAGPPETISDLAAANGVNASYFTRVLRIAYLSPDIIEAIIEGRQPPELTANKLVRIKNLPFDWANQSKVLGLANPGNKQSARNDP